MTCVLPAWTIKEVLDMPQLVEERRRFEELFIQAYGGGPTPIAEAAAEDLPATDENPTHREDFNRLLGVAATKKTEDGQT